MRIHAAVIAIFTLASMSQIFAASPDADFVRDAAKGGRHEVEIGKLADQKATHQDTKAFAKHLIDDHSKMNDELSTLAQKLGIALPENQQDDKAMMDMLNGKSGMAFDRAFANMALEHHKTDVAAFDNEAKNGNDEQVKAFAAKNLEGLRMHLKMAQDLNDKLSKGAALNDPEADAAQNVSVQEKSETVNVEQKSVETTETVPYQPAPEVRDIEREPINTSDNIVSGPINTGKNAAVAPVETAGNVASNTVNKGVDIATHPVETAKNAITHPIDTAKNIVTAPFRSDRERREYSEYRSDFRDDGYRSENVSYEGTYSNDSIECSSCEVKHHCSSCSSCGSSSFDAPVYDNDYRATETGLIDHGCNDCE